jgi:hypothetical protein
MSKRSTPYSIDSIHRVATQLTTKPTTHSERLARSAGSEFSRGGRGLHGYAIMSAIKDRSGDVAAQSNATAFSGGVIGPGRRPEACAYLGPLQRAKILTDFRQLLVLDSGVSNLKFVEAEETPFEARSRRLCHSGYLLRHVIGIG